MFFGILLYRTSLLGDRADVLCTRIHWNHRCVRLEDDHKFWGCAYNCLRRYSGRLRPHRIQCVRPPSTSRLPCLIMEFECAAYYKNFDIHFIWRCCERNYLLCIKLLATWENFSYVLIS